jgi:hypothetical protein
MSNLSEPIISKKKFNITLKSVDGMEINCDTDDIEETLKEFRPEFITGKIIITAQRGDKTVDKLLFAPEARRTFHNLFALKVLARNLTRALI